MILETMKIEKLLWKTKKSKISVNIFHKVYFLLIIKNRRKELKLSQNDLAKLIGKKRPYISRIENGEDIRLSNFSLIASALNLSIKLTAI